MSLWFTADADLRGMFCSYWGDCGEERMNRVFILDAWNRISGIAFRRGLNSERTTLALSITIIMDPGERMFLPVPAKSQLRSGNCLVFRDEWRPTQHDTTFALLIEVAMATKKRVHEGHVTTVEHASSLNMMELDARTFQRITCSRSLGLAIGPRLPLFRTLWVRPHTGSYLLPSCTTYEACFPAMLFTGVHSCWRRHRLLLLSSDLGEPGFGRMGYSGLERRKY